MVAVINISSDVNKCVGRIIPRKVVMVRGTTPEGTCKTNVYLRGRSHSDIEVGRIIVFIYLNEAGSMQNTLRRWLCSLDVL